MTQGTAIEQAVQTALMTWLAAQFADADVYDRFPDADTELPPKAITVIRAGSPVEEFLDDAIVSRKYISGNQWVYAHRISQRDLPMQIDLWATDHPDLDDMLARLAVALHASKAQTLAAFLAATGNTSQQDPVESSLTLQLADPWAHILVSYLFDATQDAETGDAIRRREFRATYTGTAHYDFTINATSAMLDRATLQTFASTAPVKRWTAGNVRHVVSLTGTKATGSDSSS